MKKRMSGSGMTVVVFMVSMIVLAGFGAVLMLGSIGAEQSASLEERRTELAGEFTKLYIDAHIVPEPERFDRFVELLLKDLLLEHPEYGVFYGFAGGDKDRIGVASRENREYQQASERSYLEVLLSIDFLQLTEEQFLNYGLLKRSLGDAVDMQHYPVHCLTFDQMWGFHQEFATVLETTPNMDSTDGYLNYLARMEYFDDMLLATIADLSECLEKGITPPRVTLSAAADQIRGLIVEDWLKSPYLKPFDEIPHSISVVHRVELRDDAQRLYEETIFPHLEMFLAFLEDEYIPGARTTLAMRELPDGERWYAAMVRSWTSTELTPEEIHDIGLAEVERIHSYMEVVKKRAGFDGTLEEFGVFLRTDPQFGFKNREHLLRTYKALAIVVDDRIDRLFGRKPSLAFEIVPVPEHLEQSVPDAYYQVGSPADDRPGRFYVNTYNPTERTFWTSEDLFLHEAVPGHHFQLAIGQEADIPWFRKIGSYGAFVEGWGLYAETLGEELGFYGDPYQKYGQLIGEQWRATRLVVDTGIHSQGWDRQKAVDFFLSATEGSIPQHQIEVEVDRYIVIPGQALSYKIGQLKFKELRTRAELALDDRFDVRAFHDFVLAGGALPLNILESQFNHWLSEQGPFR